MNNLRFIVTLPDDRSGCGHANEHWRVQLAENLSELRDATSAMVWVNRHDARRTLADGRVILIGFAFNASGPSANDGNIISGEPGPIKVAEALTRNIWGSYLALLWDDESRSFMLYRDPSGLLPCYRCVVDDKVYVASDIDLLIEIAGYEPEIDWMGLYKHIARWEIRSSRTCLMRIGELAPGYVEQAAQATSRGKRIWSPWLFTRPAAIVDRRDASAMVRERVKQCIGAWSTKCSQAPILVPVSGGVDSSIVCAGLALSNRDFACVTLATRDPSGDERRYARMVAEHLGVPLYEAFYDSAQIDLTRTASGHLPRPVTKPFVQETRRLFAEAANHFGSSAIFDGNGGDSVFCYLHSSSPISDRVLMEGIGRGVLATAADMSRITGCSMFTLLKTAARHVIGRPEYYINPDIYLLSSEFIDTGADALTPYLDDSTERQYGKLAHVAMLMRIQNFVEGYDRSGGQSLMSPLMSQPLIELCLSIPTWQWSSGGINRSVARRAFDGILPDAILTRTSKSGPDSFLYQMFNANLAVLKERILDGRLADAKLIDRRATETALRSVDGRAVHRLLEFAEIEAWISSWEGRSAAVAFKFASGRRPA